MTDVKVLSRQQAIDHMARLLQMDPIHQGMEIICARNEALGLANPEDKVSSRVDQQRKDRRELLDRLESIRSQFWALPVDELANQLNALDSRGFVDLEAAVARLKTVAAHRSQLLSFSEQGRFAVGFLSALKEIFIRSPRDTAALREEVLINFRRRTRRRRGRRMLQLLKAEMPEVYELEADWFHALGRAKSRMPVAAPRKTVASGSNSGAARYWWVIIIAATSVARLATNHSEKHGSYTPPPSVPRYQFQAPAPYVPSDRGTVDQSAANARGNPFFESDKRPWQPYAGANSSSLDMPEPTKPKPAIDLEDLFSHSRVFNPTAAEKPSDERYSQ